MKLALLLSGTSAYSIAYTNVGATTRGVFKAYLFFFHFVLGPPPKSSFIITDYPAYFSITTCTGNLFHYWGDSIIQLYAPAQKHDSGHGFMSQNISSSFV